MRGLPAVLLLLVTIGVAVRADLAQQGGRGYAGEARTRRNLLLHLLWRQCLLLSYQPRLAQLLLSCPPDRLLDTPEGRLILNTRSQQAIPSLAGNQGAFLAQPTRGQQAQADAAGEELYTEEEPVAKPHGAESAPAGKAGKTATTQRSCN